ncbi:tRNA 2'-phosphotransferase 1 isoform X2 [Anthonomus grandis grandis]|uniref:tRNA 2'-phosphotransferase 1 isoform X2 n=1 Tax=Anthonomus grandis grandis TaxID=2921223 RepID=UPI0021669262|nr:tRNA 2'-phosphotransferase 1 isoform X2 [Anthonomus grandis grandis]
MSNTDLRLSKTLSYVLRHKATDEGLNIDKKGYVKLSELLQNHLFRNKYTVEDIKRVVVDNDKQRFNLKDCNGELAICATQGHSISAVSIECFTPIKTNQPFDIIHGTYFKNWLNIKEKGLSRMSRNHIHFAKGLPGDPAVNSGIRRNAQVFIYVNLDLALAEGIKFYESLNAVILSPGDENGIILPKYFLKVTTNTHQKLM